MVRIRTITYILGIATIYLYVARRFIHHGCFPANT